MSIFEKDMVRLRYGAYLPIIIIIFSIEYQISFSFSAKAMHYHFSITAL